MPTISALFATTMLICALAFLGKDIFYFNKGGVYAWLIFLYLITLTVNGWLYASGKKKLSGIIHLLLMSGISILCLIWGFLTFYGESGPGNPVGPEVQLTGLMAVFVGGIAGICATGVLLRLLRKTI